jgi:hypothetical protein
MLTLRNNMLIERLAFAIARLEHFETSWVRDGHFDSRAYVDLVRVVLVLRDALPLDLTVHETLHREQT